jgi:Protein of unknown function (DUF2934)
MAQKPENSRPPLETPSPRATSPGAVPIGLIPMDEATAERLKKIAEAAYRRAQQRNFAPGHDLEDWFEAEQEVDAQRR